MQIKEFAQQIGVSVRTLHYYDEIGLLKPSEVDAQNGYRFYDERSLERMHEILFYRELDFSLKTIAQILLSPDYDKQQALTWQRKLLFAKKERLERLIDALDSLEKGEVFMKPNNEYEDLKNKYAEEVRQRWGSTDAYKESQQRNTDFSQAASLLDAVFEEFAELDRSGSLKNSPSLTAAGFRPTTKRRKFKSRDYSSVSPTTSIHVKTKSSRDSDRCTPPTSASKTTSTNTARVLRSLYHSA